MNKKNIFLIFFAIGFTFCAEEKVRSLCDDPKITAVDRLPNDTVRVYRGNHYWELIGLPDPVAQVSGPFKIKLQYMAPVGWNTSIMTILGKPLAGNTWKFDGERYWQWNTDGELEIGGRQGAEWKEIPRGGFHCAMNTGDYDKPKAPMMIALKGIKAYYWKTTQKIFTSIGDIYNGYIGGQFGEEFPADVTACMAFKSIDKTAKYYVYLFKLNEYCFRPITGEKGCKQWHKNTELFGCKSSDSGSTGGSGQTNTPSNGNGNTGGDQSSDAPEPVPSNSPKPDKPNANPGQDSEETTTPRSGVCHGPETQKLLLLFAFYLIYNFL